MFFINGKMKREVFFEEKRKKRIDVGEF